MKRTASVFALLALVLLTLAAWQGGPAAAQGPQQAFSVNWWTVDGGGGALSSGPGYSLGATIGQPDAGVLSGPGYILAGGFWQIGGTVYHVYLPLVMRSYP